MAQQYLRVPRDEDGKENASEQPGSQLSIWPRVALQILLLLCAAAVGYIIRDVSCRRNEVLVLGEDIVPRGMSESETRKHAKSTHIDVYIT